MSVCTGADYRLDPRLARVLAVTAAVGALAFVAGALQTPGPASAADLATPSARAWTGLLVGFHYVLALGLSGRHGTSAGPLPTMTSRKQSPPCSPSDLWIGGSRG